MGITHQKDTFLCCYNDYEANLYRNQREASLWSRICQTFNFHVYPPFLSAHKTKLTTFHLVVKGSLTLSKTIGQETNAVLGLLLSGHNFLTSQKAPSHFSSRSLFSLSNVYAWIQAIIWLHLTFFH